MAARLPLPITPRPPFCRPRPSTRFFPICKSSATNTASSTCTLKLTYLEINTWVWELHQDHHPKVRILVDPILVGDLDFGAPWLFNGAKRNPQVKALGVDEAMEPPPDLLLITQSLDDHCHVRTLKQLSALAPDLPVVTTPNARPVLASLPTPFRRVTYLEPGQSTAAADHIRILATAGPVLGPPWQRPENGYIITTADADGGLLYYEPHCVYDSSFLESRLLRAQVVVTPVVKQFLPANFTLVSGQEDAVDLVRLLQARYVVPMSNGDVDASGLVATVLATQGTTQSFKAMLSEALPEAQVLDAAPGVPLQLRLDLHQPAAATTT
jgi:L-ascorbate metabolism protein UlaG (beta-lactamase superfamily)